MADPPAPRWPLSVAQLGILLAHQLDPGNPQYNCGGYLEIHGPVDEALLRQAVGIVMAQSEALRVRVQVEDGQPWQVLLPDPGWSLQVVDVGDEPDPMRTAEAWMRTDMSTPVDLTGPGPLFHQVMFRLAPDRCAYYLRYHHMVLDGFGQTLYWRRVGQAYTMLACGDDPTIVHTTGRLSDLLDEEATYRAGADYARDRQFWVERFADPIEPAVMAGRRAPTGGPTTARAPAGRGLRRRIAWVPDVVAAGLRATARRLGTRWSAVVLAAAAAYLHRMGGSTDVVLRLPVSGRLSPLARVTPAMLANELPLRLTVRPDTTLAELAAAVSREVGQVLRHQRYRGEELLRELRRVQAESRVEGPVVNVVSFDHEVCFGTYRTTPHHLSSGPVRDLSIDLYGSADGARLHLYLDANAQRYDPSLLGMHQRRFLAFLHTVGTADPQTPIGKLDLLDPDERRRIVAARTASRRPYDLSRCVPELIDEQTRRTPEATAAEMVGGALTYHQLTSAADRLAAYLGTLGVEPGTRVGVADVRSLELVVSLLAVLKAGAAYVPLDPEAPTARTLFQVQDAGVRVVLTRTALSASLPRHPSQSLAGQLDEVGVPVVPVDELLPLLPAATPPQGLSRAADPAYVIYTSGSTGAPKGVVVPHRGLTNRLLWMQEEYHLDAGECVLQKAPFTFDVSVWELFWPLVVGARLFLAAPGAHRDPRALVRDIREHGVTTVHFVPPMLDLFLAELAERAGPPEDAEATEPAAGIPGLRRVFCSGEVLPAATVRRFFEQFPETGPGSTELHNLYGPTEASIDVTYWRCSPRDAAGPVPIGRPVANTSIYLLDPADQPVGVGVAGQLHIGGVQVARGYLNRPELTAERFVPDPFAGGTMYRTGDLARYRTDGVIEFLGRMDDQVKVRGFRVEPGEIETVLRDHPAVESAVVTLWQRTETDRRLVAYVTLATGTSDDDLVGYVATRLPEYLVPAHVVMLDALPLLPNGKISRAALPEPMPPGDVDVTSARFSTDVAPRTDAERLLHEVWREVLGSQTVSVTHSFVALGGDSILSIRVRAGLERRGYTADVADIIGLPIRELAARLRPVDLHGGRSSPPTVAFGLVRAADRARLPSKLDDAYPLSVLQAGMLFHTDYDDDTAVYRVVTSLQVSLALDVVALRQAVADTLHRHPALRSSFDLTSYSEPLQLVHRDVEVPLTVEPDLGDLPDTQQRRAVRDWVDRAKFHRFDTTRPPLLVFAVHPRGEGSFQLSVVEHHAVLDGWSDAVMLDEIVQRYQAQRSGEELWLPEVSTTYRDFVADERRTLADPTHRAFWTELLRDAEPTALPRPAPLPRHTAADSTHDVRGTHRGYHVDVPPVVASRLRAAARGANLPLKSLLAAAHVAVLRLVGGGDRVLTGMVGHGRPERGDGDEVIGVFLNTLPLYLVDVGSHSWLATAGEILAYEQRVAPHRRYPYAQIQRDLDGSLQLDSYVNFMDLHRQWHAPASGIATIIDGFGVAETNFALAVNFLVDPVRDELRLWLDCDVSVLDEDLCTRLAGYYRRALDAIAAAPDAAMATVDLRGTDEVAQLAAWNATAVDYDRTVPVHRLFERCAARWPEATALVHSGMRLSYAELDTWANRLAHHLRGHGVGPGSRVGVELPRGPELVAALLAVLKAGGAYVPLDPDFPAARLAFIAADARLDLLLNAEKLTVDAPRMGSYPTTAPPGPDATGGAVTGEEPAYIVYTSGSTGAPKGTIVRHRNVVSFFAGMDERVGCGPQDVVLALTSISFDISVLELLWPLARGASVVVAGERLIGNLVSDENQDMSDEDLPDLPARSAADAGGSFTTLLRRNGVTLVQGTPSFLSAVAAEPAALEALRRVRAVLVGGEAFPAGLAARLLATGVHVYNMYGPTETTVWSTVHELTTEDSQVGTIPIGRPIANTQALVVDDAGGLLPIGVPGELWIAGDGVAAGYLDRADVTAQRFVVHSEEYGLAYRTGDRVRWRADGLLEFLGRVDRQVKILGHRVEPDEIESVLSRHPQVGVVAVVPAARSAGSVELVAYVAPAGGLADAAAEKAHVRRWGEVWDSAYTDPAAGVSDVDGDRDFAGWVSSYTGEPIPPAEMREWLRQTVARVTALRPRRVVDVGVGVGLLLRALVGRVERYHGFDVAKSALQTAAASLSAGDMHVILTHDDASRLADLRSGSADLVVLSSVVQYFPGTAYLDRVLGEAVRVAGPAGAVYIGDVRDFDLLPAFHADIALHRAPPLLAARELALTAARQAAEERELCLSTDYFRRLARDLTGAGVGEVRVELRRGYVTNELTTYRYDVTLLGDAHPARRVAQPGAGVPGVGVPGEVVAWSQVSGAADPLAELVLRTASMAASRRLTVTGIPNARLTRPLALRRLLAEAGPDDTAWELERRLWEACGSAGVDPERLAETYEHLGCRVTLLPPEHGAPGSFDAVVEPHAVVDPVEQP